MKGWPRPLVLEERENGWASPLRSQLAMSSTGLQP